MTAQCVMCYLPPVCQALVDTQQTGERKLRQVSERAGLASVNTDTAGVDIIQAEVKCLTDQLDTWMTSVQDTNTQLGRCEKLLRPLHPLPVILPQTLPSRDVIPGCLLDLSFHLFFGRPLFHLQRFCFPRSLGISKSVFCLPLAFSYLSFSFLLPFTSLSPLLSLLPISLYIFLSLLYQCACVRSGLCCLSAFM